MAHKGHTMTQADMLDLFRALEWVKYRDQSECAICYGLRPQHAKTCKLTQAIATLAMIPLL